MKYLLTVILIATALLGKGQNIAKDGLPVCPNPERVVDDSSSTSADDPVSVTSLATTPAIPGPSRRPIDCLPQCIRIELGPDRIKLLNTAPLLVIPAPGDGRFIDIITWTGMINFKAPAYTGTPLTPNLALKNISGTISLAQSANFLNATESKIAYLPRAESPPVGQTQVFENEPVFLTVLTANPQNGQSFITIWVYYRIVTTNPPTNP